MPGRISEEQKQALRRYVARGMSIMEAARRAGIGYPTALGIIKKDREVANNPVLAPRGADPDTIATWPIPLSSLSKQAKSALTDIDLFATTYYGLKLVPWHIQATNRIQELYATPEEEFVVINVAVGSGKTTFFTRVLPAWLTCNDRSIRGLLGSASQGLATNLTRLLRADFSNQYPHKASARDITTGTATDAFTTLVQEYGRFRPEGDEEKVWKQDAFIVAQHDNAPVTGKEPTWVAFGRDSAFIGFRVQIAVWDDVYDPSKVRSAESLRQMQDWWIDIAEKRVEPGGLLILQGQRLAQNDIYGFALEQHVPVISYDSYHPDGEMEYKPKYHHIVFKAHYEDLCNDPLTHRPDTANAWPYPLGCLLYPRRIPHRRILEEQYRDNGKFQTIYQQEPESGLDNLVRRIWIEGGIDAETGEEFEGCYDPDRGLCEYPRGLTPPLYSFAMVDPSVANMWAVEWVLYHPKSQQRFLLDIHHGRMGGNDLLDWLIDEQRFAGLMDDWQQRSLKLGIPISHWIVEVNAAHKYLLQMDAIKRWRALNSVQIVPHTTGINKTNSDYGITTIASHFRFGRVRIPAKGPAKPKFARFVKELCNFRTDFSHTSTDDTVMAYWFFEWNAPRLAPAETKVVKQRRPAWVADFLPNLRGI